jgi:hypothetical protein
MGTRRTKLTLDVYANKNLSSQIIFKLGRKKKLEDTFQKSLQNLTTLVKEIQLPAATL